MTHFSFLAAKLHGTCKQVLETKKREKRHTTTARHSTNSNNNNLLSRAKKYTQHIHIKQCITLPNKQSKCKKHKKRIMIIRHSEA